MTPHSELSKSHSGVYPTKEQLFFFFSHSQKKEKKTTATLPDEFPITSDQTNKPRKKILKKQINKLAILIKKKRKIENNERNFF